MARQLTRQATADIEPARRILHDNKRTSAAVELPFSRAMRCCDAFELLVLCGGRLAIFIVRSGNAVVRQAIVELNQSARGMTVACGQAAGNESDARSRRV